MQWMTWEKPVARAAAWAPQTLPSGAHGVPTSAGSAAQSDGDGVLVAGWADGAVAGGRAG